MTPAELADTAQLFLDRYIVGAAQESADPTVPIMGAGIRNRTPALVTIPPEFSPQPNGLDGTSFLNGQGPEAFSEPQALYLDCCPLERAQVTASDDTVNINFMFIVRYGPGEFDPTIKLPVCLPSGYELDAIVSECMNQLSLSLGLDSDLGTTSTEIFPLMSTSIQAFTFDEFVALKLPNVLPT